MRSPINWHKIWFTYHSETYYKVEDNRVDGCFSWFRITRCNPRSSLSYSISPKRSTKQTDKTKWSKEMCVFAVFAFRNSLINDKANHANMFLACRKKNEEKKPIKSKRKTYLRPFSPKNRNDDKRQHVFLKTTRVFGLERLFCYCRLLTSGRAVTRD